MILNASGVILSRRNIGEADRLACLYTEDMGKMTVRYTGVNKPQAKLKALSEPFAWGEFRLHISAKSEFAKVIGGRIIGTFPEIRDDFRRTAEALACCQLLESLTPPRSPNPEKYDLICSALTQLSRGASPWLIVAFGLRLLDLAGFRLAGDSVLPEDHDLWLNLHDKDLDRLAEMPWDQRSFSRLRSLLYTQAEAQAGKEFGSRLFMDKMFPILPTAAASLPAARVRDGSPPLAAAAC